MNNNNKRKSFFTEFTLDPLTTHNIAIIALERKTYKQGKFILTKILALIAAYFKCDEYLPLSKIYYNQWRINFVFISINTNNSLHLSRGKCLCSYNHLRLFEYVHKFSTKNAKFPRKYLLMR